MAGGRLGPGVVPLGMFCHPTTVKSSILAKKLDGKIPPPRQDRVNVVGALPRPRPPGKLCHPTTVKSSILAKNLDGKICPTTTGQDRVNPVGNNCNDLGKENNSREKIAMI